MIRPAHLSDKTPPLDRLTVVANDLERAAYLLTTLSSALFEEAREYSAHIEDHGEIVRGLRSVLHAYSDEILKAVYVLRNLD